MSARKATATALNRLRSGCRPAETEDLHADQEDRHHLRRHRCVALAFDVALPAGLAQGDCRPVGGGHRGRRRNHPPPRPQPRWQPDQRPRDLERVRSRHTQALRRDHQHELLAGQDRRSAAGSGAAAAAGRGDRHRRFDELRPVPQGREPGNEAGGFQARAGSRRLSPTRPTTSSPTTVSPRSTG